MTPPEFWSLHDWKVEQAKKARHGGVAPMSSAEAEDMEREMRGKGII